MSQTPSKQPQPPTRITVSSGKRAEPHLMMAHPIGETNEIVDIRLVVVGAIILIATALAVLLLLFGPVR